MMPKVLSFAVLVVLCSALVIAQSPADRQRINEFRVYLKSLEPQLTPSGVTNARNISTRLVTLTRQFLPVTPPPAPVDCVLGAPTLTSSTAWGACEATGTQTRKETWTPTVQTAAANGGQACDLSPFTVTASQSCTFVPPPPPTPGNHTYFDMLRARPDAVMTHPMRSVAELAAMTPSSKPYDPVTQRKRPIVYDPVEDAAMGTVNPPESTDTQQKWPVLAILPGESAFVTFDMRLSASWAFRATGDIITHKAQQLGGPGGTPWFTIRLMFQRALGLGVAEWVMTSNSGMHIIPQRLISTEEIEPRLARFYVQGDTWSRIAILLTDVSSVSAYTGTELTALQREKFPQGRVMRLSYWMSDENREPVQILDKVLVLQSYERIALMRLPEFDTGMDRSADTRMKYFWHRNLVQLKNPPLADIAALLQKPVN